MSKKEDKIVFKETDPNAPFPPNTMKELEKQIAKFANDLEKEWKSPMALVQATFKHLDVPEPKAYHQERWDQYQKLLRKAVRDLYKSRGRSASWSNF